MSQPLLSIQEIRVQYGRFIAVDRLSVDLGAGQLLGMIGPNGAGKTTALRAAAGLQAITAGRVRIMGHDVATHPLDVAPHLAFAPDTPPVYDMLTVATFLDFIGRTYQLPRNLREERIDFWLEQLWLTEKRHQKISALSRGMRQRLAVARALLPDPHVVLLDEPAAGRDPGGRAQFRQLLASLRDQGKAVIVSSHILADLAEYCTHILIMERGQALRFGTVAEVAGNGTHTRTQYRVLLAETVGDLAARLAQLPDIGPVDANGRVLTLECDREPAQAALLLRRLVALGLPVIEFRELAPDLEQAYLRSGIAQVD